MKERKYNSCHNSFHKFALRQIESFEKAGMGKSIKKSQDTCQDLKKEKEILQEQEKEKVKELKTFILQDKFIVVTNHIFDIKKSKEKIVKKIDEIWMEE